MSAFSLEKIVVDVPDPEADGECIAARIGAYDLTLGSYFNGIPTDVLTSATDIVVELPKDSGDEQIQQLIDLGLGTINAASLSTPAGAKPRIPSPSMRSR